VARGRRAGYTDTYMKRVVITGIGAVSPNGIGREAFWSATRAGPERSQPITRFDPFRIPGSRGGEITGSTRTATSLPRTGPHVSRVVRCGGRARRRPWSIPAPPRAPAHVRDELREIGVIVRSGGGARSHEEQYRCTTRGSRNSAAYT